MCSVMSLRLCSRKTILVVWKMVATFQNLGCIFLNSIQKVVMILLSKFITSLIVLNQDNFNKE